MSLFHVRITQKWIDRVLKQNYEEPSGILACSPEIYAELSRSRPMLKLEDWQQRVVDEKRDLDARLGRLQEFIGSELYLALLLEDQDLMREQLVHMRAFSNVLGARIARFVGTKQKERNMTAKTLEQAMIDLLGATDGQGQLVVLFHEPTLSSVALREATFAFMEPFDPECCFINGFDPKADQGKAEAAAWRNLALLATATSAAIDAGL